MQKKLRTDTRAFWGYASAKRKQLSIPQTACNPNDICHFFPAKFKETLYIAQQSYG